MSDMSDEHLAAWTRLRSVNLISAVLAAGPRFKWLLDELLAATGWTAAELAEAARREIARREAAS